jgi:hypothetical protein
MKVSVYHIFIQSSSSSSMALQSKADLSLLNESPPESAPFFDLPLQFVILHLLTSACRLVNAFPLSNSIPLSLTLARPQFSVLLTVHHSTSA